jgi:hypothetical protein
LYFSIFQVSKFIHSTSKIVSLTSTPYAPIFWIGLAPTVQGIEIRFSSHKRLFVQHRNTKEFRCSQAPLLTKTKS